MESRQEEMEVKTNSGGECKNHCRAFRPSAPYSVHFVKKEEDHAGYSALGREGSREKVEEWALTVGPEGVHQTTDLAPRWPSLGLQRSSTGGQPLLLGRAVEWQTGERRYLLVVPDQAHGQRGGELHIWRRGWDD